MPSYLNEQRLVALFAVYLSVAVGVMPSHAATVTARLVTEQTGTAGRKQTKTPPAVIWLKPLQVSGAASPGPGNFKLLQKDKSFVPHLLVVPTGSVVAFPNADPFFHNVFSLFDGKRFDLGLYEAGTSRNVVFSREGVSYIFCNIHSEMSAVVIALTTPYYSIASPKGEFLFTDVPDGEYDLHVWVEGQHPSFLEQQIRRVKVAGNTMNLGDVHVGLSHEEQHLDKFGHPYESNPKPIY